MRHDGHQFSVDSWGNFKFQVMHVSPQTMLFCMQCHGPSSVHAELRRTADSMESVRCVSSQTSSDGGLDGLGRRGGGFSAPAVIQLCYTAAPSSSADQRPAAGSHCNTGDEAKPAAGLNALLSGQSLLRAGPQSSPQHTATGERVTDQLQWLSCSSIILCTVL